MSCRFCHTMERDCRMSRLSIVENYTFHSGRMGIKQERLLICFQHMLTNATKCVMETSNAVIDCRIKCPIDSKSLFVETVTPLGAFGSSNELNQYKGKYMSIENNPNIPKEIPDFLKDSKLYALYLILEAMEPEPDDADDPRMAKLYSLVDDALLLQTTPEVVLEGRKAAEALENPVGDIPVAVDTSPE
ncbi:hypothetical protein [Vibrio phage vB_VhaP_PG11]|nr:hypothetical protein [Vibrio phage vB_VhaP_PG11]